MDTSLSSLNAHAKLDIASDIFRIDVRGSLTQDSRPDLTQLIQRVRGMGITSHIRVNLGRAAFVESVALSGLRNDLNAIDGAAALAGTAGALPGPAGVSLELNASAASAHPLVPPLSLPADITASLDVSGIRPLTVYSDDELLAVSDSVFGLMDNPADMARMQLLATYDEIGLEISRRRAIYGTGSHDVGPRTVCDETALGISRPRAAREPEPASAGPSAVRRLNR